MVFEIMTLRVFVFLVFSVVPIRTYINYRKDTGFLSFFVGQLVYGMMWFSTWAVGMVLVYQAMLFSQTIQIVYLAFAYGFTTALASVVMLFFQKGRQKDIDAEIQAKVDKKAKSFYKRKKGAKHL